MPGADNGHSNQAGLQNFFSGIIFVAFFILFTLVQIEYIESDLLSMNIIARLNNHSNIHSVTVETNGVMRELSIPVKESGSGSAVNGGELLCLALATCFCNDLYREALKKGIEIRHIRVEASAEFGPVGAPGYNFRYSAQVEGDASPEEIEALIRYTDTVSEIQNTLRHGASVVLTI